jgi:hypothetical protein
MNQRLYAEMRRYFANGSPTPTGNAMRRDYLHPADPAWQPGTVLQVLAPSPQTHAPVYIWHEKEQDMILCGFVEKGTEVTYVQAWSVRGLRYAECNKGGAPMIVMQASVEPKQ